MTARMRLGVFTPIVLMVLTVFAILGIAYKSSSDSSYGQSAQVIYAMKASMLAAAALEEAQTVIYDKVNRPERYPLTTEWKAELLGKVEEAVKAKETGTGPIIFRSADSNGWINLLTVQGGVSKVKDLARDLSAEADITECKVKFYGFRKIPYNALGSMYDKESYYAQPQIDDGAKIWVPNDFIGYYTIRASGKSRGQTKSLAVTHDMKIVNVAPIGHEFSLFQMRDKKDDVENNYYETDLNKGGPFRVFSRGWGRVHMRGQLTVEAEGLPGGEGGYGPFDKDDSSKRKPLSPNFLVPENMTGDLAWDGWHVMPNPRAGVMKREGFVGSRAQARPHTTPSGFVQTVVGGLTNAPIFSAAGSAYTRLGADPGLYIPENQSWYTGFREPTGKEFSLVGNPKVTADKLAGLSTFRGLRFRMESGNQQPVDPQAYWPIDDIGTAPADHCGTRIWGPPSNLEANWYIAPEGNLRLKCKVVKFNHPGFNWADAIRLRNPFNLRYNLEPDDRNPHPGGVMAQQLYAIHWEPVRTRGILDSVLDAVKAITPAFMFYNPAFLLFGALDPRAFFSQPVPAGAEELARGVPPKSLPLNFKGVYARAATRMYQKANNIRSVKEARTGGQAAKLVLDGVIWARELKIEAPIDYLGKGILGSEPNPDVTTQDAVVTAPIKAFRNREEEAGANGSKKGTYPNDTDRFTSNNYLTLVYQGASDNATSATQMITVKSRDAAMMVDGTVFSTHGVKPDGGNKTLILFGNYICGLINKQKIADDSKVQVEYNERLLARRKHEPATEGEKIYTKGDWHALSVSPRVSGFFEK
jgi:hypothetical protein